MEFERGKAYVVDRGAPRPGYGRGMAAGLGVVWRHFRDAFGKKLDSPSETSGVFTVQYPEERLKLPEAYRNFPILLYDDASGHELCTSCFQCERICPPQVIHMTQAKDPATGKAVPAVASFEIEYDACMSCGLCAEVCPFDAIKMDHEFELATAQQGGLTVDKPGLNRPISYYEQLAPRFWAEVRDDALKKLQANMKRRSGEIGIAPQMQAGVRGQGSAVSDQSAVGSQWSGANGQQSAGGSPESATDNGHAVTDKVAKLAAIRAANAAKQAAQAPVVETVAVAPEASQSDNSADAKAAKLAAIRAANAAKRVAEEAASTDEKRS